MRYTIGGIVKLVAIASERQAYVSQRTDKIVTLRYAADPERSLMLQPRKTHALPFYSKQDRPLAHTAQAVCLSMLKRFSSLILALLIGSGVLAGTARVQDEHVCQMAGMEAMRGMEAMPCCKKNQNTSVDSESGSSQQCCVNIPLETGLRGTTFNLRAPSFSIAVIHPAFVQSLLAAPKPYECSYSPQVFLPNLQASYIRNLSILI